MRLTDPNVARLRLPANKAEHIEFDDQLAGFGVRIRASGGKRWIVQYRIGKKQRRITLGTIATLNADAARKRARSMLAKVELGDDPKTEIATKRARAELTLGALSERYLAEMKNRLRERSYAEVERHLKIHWAPLKEIGAHQVERRNVAARLSDIANSSGDVAANRSRASLSAMFAWAMRQGLIEGNPVIDTEKRKEHSRERVLSDAELAEIWKACDREDDYSKIVRLLILTGQRRQEVGGMTKKELDRKAQLWTIPGNRTKNGKPHEVPLSDAAFGILEKLEGHNKGLLFGRGEELFSGWSGAKDALDQRILDARAEKGNKAQLDPWVLHDIRRSVRTGMGRLKILPHVCEAVANRIGHKSGTAGVYDRYDYGPEKRQALDLWASHVEALVSGKATNIVPLRAAT